MSINEVKEKINKHSGKSFRFQTIDGKANIGTLTPLIDTEKIKFVGWVKTPNDLEDKYEGNKTLNYSDIKDIDFI